MKKIAKLRATIADRINDLAQLEANKPPAGSTSDESRWRHRQMIADTKEDIVELKASLERAEAYDRSEDRAKERAAGRAALALAAGKMTEAKKLWTQLQANLDAAKALGAQLNAIHSEVTSHVDTALRIDAAFDEAARDPYERVDLEPFLRGHSTVLVSAVACQIRDVLKALPCGGRVTREYLNPEMFADWRDKSLDMAALNSFNDLFARLANKCKDPA